MENAKNFKYFMLLIIIAVTCGIIKPSIFLGIKPYIPSLLGIVMFSIGLTLQTNDFKQVYQLKWQMLGLIIIKYSLLPIVTFLLVKLLHLPNEDLIGLLLVSAAPGGTSAGIMSFLARANVALTVVLTLITTLLAPIIMPMVVYIFLHKYIVIPIYDMASSIFWIVLFPLIDGLIIRRLLGAKRIEPLQKIVPWIAIIAISIILTCIMALNHQRIVMFPLKVIVAVVLDNLLGVIVGFYVAKLLFRLKHDSCLSVGFEFGLQDSGLAVVLANKFFGVATALSGAIFSVIQNITGIFLARLFMLKDQG